MIELIAPLTGTFRTKTLTRTSTIILYYGPIELIDTENDYKLTGSLFSNEMKIINLIIRINSGSTLTVLNQVFTFYEDDIISFNIPKLNNGQTLEILASTSEINRGVLTITIQKRNTRFDCMSLLVYYF